MNERKTKIEITIQVDPSDNCTVVLETGDIEKETVLDILKQCTKKVEKMKEKETEFDGS
ncbi:hypothetical protein [uncultured Dubosiella sp.]|uniref:hypothetical protein n=1 Tax=uncultured Dubosiella sp. TaxID=1937011 RepID=UPI002730ACB0|nr:hypothetical protein [uncultured Dubosiella sp.]